MKRFRKSDTYIIYDRWNLDKLFIQNKEKSKKENNKKKSTGLKINIEAEQIRKGLYDADDIMCSSAYLDKFYIEGDDPGNNQMINRVTEDQFTYSISKGYYNHESHINKNKNLRERIIKKSACKEIYERESAIAQRA